jgi:hypothetical protein
MKQIITIENIESFIGKTIRWSVARSSDNAMYGDYAGEAVIRYYDPSNCDHPFEVEQICGDRFTAWRAGDTFYSGGDYNVINAEVVDDEPFPAPANSKAEIYTVNKLGTDRGFQGLFSGFNAIRRQFGRIVGEDGQILDEPEFGYRVIFTSPLDGAKHVAELMYLQVNEQDSLL